MEIVIILLPPEMTRRVYGFVFAHFVGKILMLNGEYNMSYWCKISFKKIEAEDIQDFFLGAAQKCTPDANGRIILDEGLLKYAGITKNIVFVGAGRQIRIWSEEKWIEREQNRDYEEMRNKMRSYGL